MLPWVGALKWSGIYLPNHVVLSLTWLVCRVELQCHLVDKANKLLQEHASAKVAAQIEFKCADAMSVALLPVIGKEV